MRPFLTVFVPAYNEQGSLERCAQVVMGKLAEMGVEAELLVVNDGSRDGTAAVAERLAQEDPRICVIHHPRNLGIGQAFLTAIAHASSEWLILIPSDLALEPGEISRYIQAAPQADIVVGLRSNRSDYTFLRRIVSWVNIHTIQGLFGIPLQQFQYISMYRLSFLRQINIEYANSAFFLAEVLIKAHTLGYRLVEAEIRYAPRLSGRPTGAKLLLILLTARDMLQFWLRWLRLGPQGACRAAPAHPNASGRQP